MRSSCGIRLSVFVISSTLLVSCTSSTSAVDRELASATVPAGGQIATGTMLRWPEATQHLRFDVSSAGISAEIGAAREAGLDAYWSVASTAPGSGFFYSDSIRGTSETRVAHATGARGVKDIHDAAALDFTRESVGPVPIGGIVVVEHMPTGRYLALVVDAIAPTDPRTAGAGPYAHADVTWYLTPPGVTDFAGAP